MIYWLTGQPSHGKTTLAKKLVNFYQLNNKKLFHVDGDDLRKLTINKDYSKEGRMDNVKSAQKIAHFLHNEGYDVVVSLISPYRSQREELKKILNDEIIEFYVHTSESRERDNYKVVDYEPPLENFIDIDTTIDDPNISFSKILKIINEKLYNKNK
jgi:hypothetical protein